MLPHARKREKGRQASRGSSDIKDARMEARLAAMEDRFVTFLGKQMERDDRGTDA